MFSLLRAGAYTFIALAIFSSFNAASEVQNVTTAEVKVVRIPCTCSLPSCSCCAQFSLGQTTGLQAGCAVVTFDRQDRGVRLQLQVAGRTLYDREASVVNPPPACVPVPMVPFTRFCGQLYDVRVNRDEGNACLKLELQVLGSDAAVLDLQCLHLENGMVSSRPAG